MFSPPLDIWGKSGPILKRIGTKTAPKLNTIFLAFIDIFIPQSQKLTKDNFYIKGFKTYSKN